MTKRKNASSSSRRTFLKTISLAGISGLLLPKNLLRASNKAISRVAIIEDSAAASGSSINSSVVQTMVQSGIKSLGQNSSVGDAWKALLPGVSSSSIIAIKVNCINSGLPTHPEVTYAVANSLKEMMFSGNPFSENNIIIYDDSDWALSDSGYTTNSGSTGIRCFGTVDYSTESYDVAGESEHLSTIITSMANYLINIAVLKNHGSAGVTLCMKNHFGTCDNLDPLHGGYCDPYLPALNATTPIRTKQKVNIIDALFGVYDGGPSGTPQFAPNKIIMSADIVATDYWGRKLLADYRGPHGQKCSTIDIATHIDTAANAPYSLGTNNPANMTVDNIINPSNVGVSRDDQNIPQETRLEQNYPNPFNPSTNIQYTVKNPGQVILKVYNINGKEITTLVDGFHAAGKYNTKFYGQNLSSGVYVCRLQTIDGVFSRKIVLMK